MLQMVTREEIENYIRTNIIRLRLRAGLSQNELAQWSGVSNIAMIEAGKKAVSREGLAKIITALGITLKEFHYSALQTEDDAMRQYMELSSEGKQFVVQFIEALYQYDIKMRFRE